MSLSIYTLQCKTKSKLFRNVSDKVVAREVRVESLIHQAGGCFILSGYGFSKLFE